MGVRCRQVAVRSWPSKAFQSCQPLRLDGAHLLAGEDQLLRETCGRLSEGWGNVIGAGQGWFKRGIQRVRAGCRLLRCQGWKSGVNSSRQLALQHGRPAAVASIVEE